MVEFVIKAKPEEQWVGGPPAWCHGCNFPNEASKGFLVCRGIKVLIHDNIEVDLHLCLDQHAAELKAILDEIMPDPTAIGLKGKLLSAEAARARAEKRADKAEAALHAMQDWLTEKPEAAAK